MNSMALVRFFICLIYSSSIPAVGVRHNADMVQEHVRLGSHTERRVSTNTTESGCHLHNLGCLDLLRRLSAGERCEFYAGFLQCEQGMKPISTAFKLWHNSPVCSEYYISEKCVVQVLPGHMGYRMVSKSCRNLHLGPQDCEHMQDRVNEYQTQWPAEKMAQFDQSVLFSHEVMDLKKRGSKEWVYLPNIRHIVWEVAQSLNVVKDVPRDDIGDDLGPLWNILLTFCEIVEEKADESASQGFDQTDVQECPGLTMMDTLAPYHPALMATNEGLTEANSLEKLMSYGVFYFDRAAWKRLVGFAGYTNYTESWRMLSEKAKMLETTAPNRGISEFELAMQLFKTHHELFGAAEPEGGKRRLDEMVVLSKLRGITRLRLESHQNWPDFRNIQATITKADSLGAVSWVDAGAFTASLAAARETSDKILFTLTKGDTQAISEAWDYVTTTTTTELRVEDQYAKDDALFYATVETTVVVGGDECDGGYVLKDGQCVRPNTNIDVTSYMNGASSHEFDDGITYRCCCLVTDGDLRCSLKNQENTRAFRHGCGGLVLNSHSWNNMPSSGYSGIPPVDLGKCMVPFGQLPLVVLCSIWGDSLDQGACVTRSTVEFERMASRDSNIKDVTELFKSQKTLSLSSGQQLCCCKVVAREISCVLVGAASNRYKCGNLGFGYHSWNKMGRFSASAKYYGRCVVQRNQLPAELLLDERRLA